MSPAELAKHCATGAPPEGMEYSEALTTLARATTSLRGALADLIEQVESLDDYTLTRDTETYKAQASWDWAIEKAGKALKAVQP